MKKLVLNFVIFLIFLFILFIVILSTFGIETNKFNKLISENVSQAKILIQSLIVLNLR